MEEERWYGQKFDFEVKILREREFSIKVEIKRIDQVDQNQEEIKVIWLPKRSITMKRIDFQHAKIQVPRWLATKKRLIRKLTRRTVGRKDTKHLLYKCLDCDTPCRLHPSEFSKRNRVKCPRCGSYALDLDTEEFEKKMKS